MTKNKFKKIKTEIKKINPILFLVAIVLIYKFIIPSFTTVSAQNEDQESVTTSGSVDNGAYYITYDEPQESTDYQVNVKAINNLGEVVSNTASCMHRETVEEFRVSCDAYSSLASEIPQTFFNADNDEDSGDQVYWKSNVINGEAPFTYEWGGNAISGGGDNQNVGPFEYSTLGQTKTAILTVTDSDGNEAQASCPIFIRECLVDDECAQGMVCSQNTFTCELPPPVFTSPLTLNPGVTNEGGTCGLSWIVDSADSCILYKNSVPIDLQDLENTTSVDMQVDPGTYTILCENPETEFTVTGGPVRCLVNPNIREQ